MSREVHVRFCEGPKVKLLRPTHPCLPMARGILYRVAADWFTRRVLSHRVSITREADFCVEALEEAIGKHGKPGIFNIGQGSQFTSAAFTGVPLETEIAISMDGKGAWRGDVFVERLWRSMKYEEVCLKACDTAARSSRRRQEFSAAALWPQFRPGYALPASRQQRGNPLQTKPGKTTLIFRGKLFR